MFLNAFLKDFTLKIVYTLNPNDPCFGGLTFKTRGHWGSRFANIRYLYIFYICRNTGCGLPPMNSAHQNHYIFSRGSLYIDLDLHLPEGVPHPIGHREKPSIPFLRM